MRDCVCVREREGGGEKTYSHNRATAVGLQQAGVLQRSLGEGRPLRDIYAASASGARMHTQPE